MKVQQLLAGGLMVAVAATLTAAPASFANHHEGGGKDGMKRQCDKDGGGGKCHKGKHGKGMKEAHEKFAKELGLTDAQKDQLKASHESFKESNKAGFEAMKSKHARLKELKESGQADSTEAQALKAELKANREAMFARHEADMKTVLTPEQFAKFQTMKAERKAQWEAKKEAKKQERKNKKDAPAGN